MNALRFFLVLALASPAVLAARPRLIRPSDAPPSALGKIYPRVPERADLARQFRFAVLDPVMSKATGEERQVIDRVVFEVRRATNVQIPGLGVMTKENMIEILGPEKAANCEGQCAATTGMQVGADYIVDGVLRRTSSGVEAELRLWQTKNGVQLSTILAAGVEGPALVQDVKANMADLLKPVQMMLDAEVRAARGQEDTRNAQAEWDAAQSTEERQEKAVADAQAHEEALRKQGEETRIREAAQAQARIEDAKSSEVASGRHGVLRKVGWTALGLGVVSGAVAGIAAIKGAAITKDLQGGTYSTAADLKSDSDSVKTINSIAVIAGIAGGALAVTGLGLVLFNQDAEGARVDLSLSPSGLLVAGRF